MNYIKFLGTAGARIVVARQLRSSAGIWLSLGGKNIYIDPGPGALVECFRSKPVLDPLTLDAIFLSHKHLDHSNDINAMIEAMSLGGHEKRGQVFVPQDALSGDPVVLKYVRKYPAKISTLKEKGKYKLGKLTIETPLLHAHGCHTYGFRFKHNGKTLSYITDTRYFDGLAHAYRGSDILVISVLSETKLNIDHLCLIEAEKIISQIKPRLAILTHFGRMLLKAGPSKYAARITKNTGIKTIAAKDGMTINI